MHLTGIVQFAVFGLGVGAIYALAAQGITLIYRGSGVINFAHGAMALAGATFYAQLQGRIPALLDLAVAVLLSALLGALTQLLIMRPLRRSSPLTRLVATLGLLVVIEQLVVLKYATGIEFIGSILPVNDLIVAGIRIGEDRVILFGIAVGLTAALWLVYRYTSFGRATWAVAENERAAASLGHSPTFVATVNWAAGGALAGLAGVLILGITGLDPDTLTLLVIPALASALIGGFASFPLTLLGGVMIGIAQSEITQYVSTTGWSDAVPFLVIIAVMVVRGRGLPQRSHLQDRLPEIGSGRIRLPLVAAGLALWGGLLFVFSADWADAVTSSMVVGTVCLSLVLVTGYCGQLSLAQFALAGMGGFFAARLAAVFGLPFPLAVLIGILATIPVGLLVALPALRTRGANLAVVTVGLALTFERLILDNPSYTGGLSGTVVPTPRLFGWDVYSVTHPARYAIVAIGVFTICGLLLANLRRGAAGRRLLAVRANERAAACLGINVVGAKLYAFGLGAAIAAAAGGVIAFRVPHVDFTQYGGLQSINAVVDTVIGGVGFVMGGFLGGSFATGGLNQELLAHVSSLYTYVTMASGALLILVVMLNPNGLAFENVRQFRRIRRRLRPVGPATPALPPQTAPPSRADGLLEVTGITVQFGGVRALAGAGVTVRAGEVIGLIGPNGAGKTAFLDVVSGLNRRHGGTVRLDGRRVDGWSAHRRARAGLGRSFQGLDLFEDQAVLENLRTASDHRRSFAYLADLVRPRQRPLPPAAVTAVHELGIEDTLGHRPGELSYGRRRLVSIARALAAEPTVLLLDEPAAGLDDRNSANLATLIRQLADRWGLAILLVEHDMSLVMRVCDRITVLDFGHPIAEGPPAAVRADAKVIAAYLGEPAPSAPQEHPEPVAETAGVPDGRPVERAAEQGGPG